jgi:SAM-dependent methyltransferase
VTWYHVVAERDHEIQNPMSAEKIRLLGTLLDLGPETHVLDIACGRAGPAIVLASTFGCRITGVEMAPEFATAARTRIREAGIDDLVEVVETDAREFPLERAAWDAVLCLGATFIWENIVGTLDAIAPAARPGGCIAVGEPYWREEQPARVDDMGYVDLRETRRRFEAAGLATIGLVDASVDDWDRYESLHWRSVESWLAAHPDDPRAVRMRKANNEYRDRYLAVTRGRLGWAIFAGRKPG